MPAYPGPDPGGVAWLFLKHGYAGTRIGQITAACAISRAGFYTYFRDKQEIFNALGVAAYRAVQNAVAQWDDLPGPGSRADLANWVAGYFALMDEHGPFIFSASQSAPTDEQTQADAHRMQMRTAWALGTRIQARQRVPSDTPDTLGLAALALLDRSWFFSRQANLPVSDPDMIRHGRRLARRGPRLAGRVVGRLRQGEDFRPVLRAEEARGDRRVSEAANRSR